MKKLKELLQKYGEIIRYLIIGVLTTLISIITYFLLTATIFHPEVPLELQMANAISWIISVIFAYFTNRSFVFRVKDSHIFAEFLGFTASRVFTFLVEAGFMFLTVSVLHQNDRICKIIAQAVVIVLNYILSKFLVFRKNSKD